MKDILKNTFKEKGIAWNEEKHEKFILYKKLLLEWNRKFNLTAITGETDIAVKHFIDSLSIWSAVKERENLADVGSGAGFPGIPLKIAGYTGETVLMDSLNKRVGFLEIAIMELGLENTSAVHIRAEDAGRGVFREYFDTVTARAVADLRVLCEYCMPLVKKGGLFIAMKGHENRAEIQQAAVAIKKMGGRLGNIEKFKLQGTEMERTLIYIEKTDDTPNIYPRKAGTPRKKPL